MKRTHPSGINPDCHSPIVVLGLLVVLGSFTGCVTTERVYLTQVEAAGPIALPPVIPTMSYSEAGATAIVPHFSVNSEQKITGRVNPVGTTPQWGGTNNLVWNIPRTEGGLDFQVCVSPSVAFLFGGVVGGVDGNTFGSFRAGLGVFGVKENAAIRLDGGVQLLSIRTRVRTTVETEISSIFGSSHYRSNFDDTRDETSFSPYIGLTLNTASRTSPVNGVFSVGVSGQPLFDLYPSQPDTVLGAGDRTSSMEKIRETIAVYSITPALAVQLGGGQQLLVGARIVGNFSIDQSSPDIFWQPFIQLVMHF